jgi:exodeoxyribonuclease V alpha subunit
MAVYSGNVETIIFSNAEDNYYILRMKLDKSPIGIPNSLVVRGKVSGLSIKKGSWFSFDGVLDSHPKHGKQMKIRKAPVQKKNLSGSETRAILRSHGVSELIADQLFLKFGDLTYSKLNSPDALKHLSSLKNVTQITAEFILQRWRSYIAFFEAVEFFEEVGIHQKKYDLVWKTFGDRAKEILSTNPWRLTRIEGITFEHADAVAKKLHLPLRGVERVQGAILSALNSWRGGMGHLYHTVKEIQDSIEKMMGVSIRRDTVIDCLKKLDEDGDLVFESYLTCGGELHECVYTKWNHRMEHKGSEMLYQRHKSAQVSKSLSELERYKYSLIRCEHPDIEAHNLKVSSLEDCVRVALDFECEVNSISLSKAQYQAAINALIYPVSIITGLPGTGKTTTLRIVVKVFQRAGVTFKLVSPTGIASKRLHQVTGVEASTIHRAFGSKGGKGDDEEREQTYYGVVGESVASVKAGENEKWTNVLPDQVLICDEASMVDQHLLYRMLTGTNGDCRLVLVGDSAQLPSVGAGNVLREMIQANLFPTSSLTEIFRQSDTSDIVYAAHDIYKGNVPELKASTDLDFVFLPISSESQILDAIKKLSLRIFKARERFQVMSPRHSGTLGVTNLNTHLREILNPEKHNQNYIRVGDQILREDDRVMIIRNDYGKGVFNGDTGKVYRIQPDKKVIVKIHGENPFYVDFTPKEVYQYLRLAYATTVHKMQGQETDMIILPMVQGFRSQLQRNLFYTAITRAKKRVILLGHASAIERAVMNSREDVRNTLLKERLFSQAERDRD